MSISSYPASGTKDIPRTQGIYAFFLDLVSPAKIGLSGKGPWTAERLTQARATLVDRCDRQAKILSSMELIGTVAEREKHPHLTRSFNIRASPIPPAFLESQAASIPLDTVRNYAGVLHASFMLNPPVYVGITQKQNLRERYEQHQADYYSAIDNNTFGGRLLALGVEWDDVMFTCIPFQGMVDEVVVLPALERHLQAMTTPILSIR